VHSLLRKARVIRGEGFGGWIVTYRCSGVRERAPRLYREIDESEARELVPAGLFNRVSCFAMPDRFQTWNRTCVRHGRVVFKRSISVNGSSGDAWKP
jgi:hypothetical protein